MRSSSRFRYVQTSVMLLVVPLQRDFAMWLSCCWPFARWIVACVLRRNSVIQTAVTGSIVTINAFLQSNCKQDPESYRSEFQLQWSHFLALKDLFALKPSQKSPEFGDMVHFLSHVSQCYTEIAQQFSECLVELLDKHAAILHPQLRMQLLQALMHMRHRNVLGAETVLELCFRLFSCHDKLLKATLHSYIVQDIKLANARSRNERLNKSMQNYLYRIIEVRDPAMPEP